MDSVNVSIGVVISELREGLAQGSRHLSDFTNDTKKARSGVLFFANSFREVTGASSVMGTAISGALSGLMMGGPLGLSVAGIQALVSHLKAVREAAEKNTEAMKRWNESIQTETEKSIERVRVLRAEMAGGDVAGSEEQAKIDREHAQKKLQEAQRKLIEAQRAQREAVYQGDREAANKTVEAAKAARDSAIKNFRAVFERTQLEIEKANRRAEEERNKAATEAAKVDAEREAALYRLANANEVWIATLEREAELDARKVAAGVAADGKRAEGELFDPSRLHFAGGDNAGGALDNANKSLSAGVVKDTKKEMDDVTAGIQTAMQVGEGLSDILGSVGDAFGGSAKSMMGNFGKLIQQAIQLGVAMSAAAGPLAWLNVAVSAAAIMATIAGIPEFRAAGGSVVSGRPYIVGEKGPELMVPGQSGTIVPNDALGGLGGTTVQFNISTMDARSFEDALRRNDSALLRVLNDAMRDRRW